MNDETEILKRDGSGSLIAYKYEQIEAGYKVEGWVAGVLTSSHPQLGLAKRIVVIE
ncbi:MAG: hypothetical protein WD355_10660 [Balneolaceae bacterium]